MAESSNEASFGTDTLPTALLAGGRHPPVSQQHADFTSNQHSLNSKTGGNQEGDLSSQSPGPLSGDVTAKAWVSCTFSLCPQSAWRMADKTWKASICGGKEARSSLARVQ